jgi:hypothetical protein
MTDVSIAGGCQCGALRFELRAKPLFTHACHCLNCRRRSGTAFGLNTFVLRADLTVSSGTLAERRTSPRTTVYLCADCGTTIFSGSTRFPSTYIVRGGTIDDPSLVVPQAHVWVKRKHPWISVPYDTPSFDEDYDIDSTWPRESLDRLDIANNATPRKW